jgi:D-proline reductase (dithiol) PrdB
MSGANFAEIEQTFVRERINPDFTWHAFDEYSPLNLLEKPLSESRVAFVTTCGAHLKSDPPFDLKVPEGDPSFREFPIDVTFDQLELTHRGYDTELAKQDVNTVLPLDHLRQAVADRRIGEPAPTVYSFMGFVADTPPLLDGTASEIAQRLLSQDVDLVLLAPT